MRRNTIVTGGVLVGTLVALAMGAGWKKRSAQVALASTKVACAGKQQRSVPPAPEEGRDDVVDRYRRAAAI